MLALKRWLLAILQPCGACVLRLGHLNRHSDAVMMAVQIDLNVWAHTVLLLVTPEWADPLPQSASPADRRRSAILWLLTSLIGAACCTFIAWALPYFSTVMGIIAAVGDMSAAFILPALFSLRLVRPACMLPSACPCPASSPHC